MSIKHITASALVGLAQLNDETVHCVVTSPPYWGLRQYLDDEAPEKAHEIGLEPTLAQHIATLVAVFREARRVLRKDGTLWLNYGDAYNADGRKGRADMGVGKNAAYSAWMNKTVAGTKPKDLLMIPERLAIALQDDGWYVRARIIWAKPNPMPESVTDRPTKSHEHVWLLTKAPRYFYDADAIKEEAAEPDRQRNDRIGGANGHTVRHSLGGMIGASQFRNCRDVWTIATSPYSDAHFATMPPELAERCIKAGCPAGGTVLDPFGGSGTTGMVADRLERNAILIDLNPDYTTMQRRRIARDRLARKKGTMEDIKAAQLPPTPLELLMSEAAP